MHLRARLAFLPTFVAAFCALVCACAGASFSLTPIADAFVATGTNGNLTGDNFGAAGALALAAPGLPQGEFQSVIEFNLAGARSSFDAQFGAGQWAVQSVTLQLVSSPHNNVIFNNIAAGQFNISLMQNNSWVEGTGTGGAPTTNGISYNTLQSTYINNAVDQPLGVFSFPGGSSGTNGYALNLSSGLISDLLAGNDLSLRLYAADSTVSYLFSSRQQSSNAPDLIITASPEPGSLALGALGLAVLAVAPAARRIRKRLVEPHRIAR